MSDQTIRLALQIAVAIVMLGMGLSLSIQDFTSIAKKPKPVIIGVVNQIVLLPSLAFVICLIVGLSPGIAIGLMLIAAAPGGPVSNMYTNLAKGDLALSVSLTAVTSLLCILSIPIILSLSLNYFLDTSNPDFVLDKQEIITTLLLVILVPVATGMTINKYFPNFSLKVEKSVRIFSVIILAIIIVGAIIAKKDLLLKALPLAGTAIILLNIVTMALGYFSGKWFKLPENQRISIAIECGIQNGTLALSICAIGVLANIEEAVLAPAIYSVWQFFSGAGISYLAYKRNQS